MTFLVRSPILLRAIPTEAHAKSEPSEDANAAIAAANISSRQDQPTQQTRPGLSPTIWVIGVIVVAWYRLPFPRKLTNYPEDFASRLDLAITELQSLETPDEHTHKIG